MSRMFNTLKKWLQLFRAQTAPATICLIMLPYLMNADLFTLQSLILFMFCILIHWISFGQNSLLDTAMGYDKRDPSKSHHPLITGAIKLSTAHNIIHWSLCGLAVGAILISLWLSPNPLLAIICIVVWSVFGYAYNSGLDKECILGFLPISISFAAMGAFGYFLSHSTIDLTGWILMLYFFVTILFQCSYSGHLKEIEVGERSNILTRMGAKVDVTGKGEKTFDPGHAYIYGFTVKMINIVLAAILLQLNYSLAGNIPFFLFGGLALYYLILLISPRKYVKSKELLNMSIEEIATIFLPLGILLPWHEALILMAAGVLYFFGVNRLIWKVPYPKV